jgi:endonuclease/exonuclease/phosphatase family metal-dependent hydrolase
MAELDAVKRGTSMIDYRAVDASTAEGRRTAAGLLRLKTGLRKDVPAKLIDGNLLLATWNVREFGGTKAGGRNPEDLHYIAEIISAFDAVALQEIRDDVRGFRRVKELLGDWWEFMVTDVTQGRAGNHERIGFLYDTRKIQFSGLSSQVVLPPDTKQKAARQLARIPFMVSMRAGWFKFVICAVHIYYGAAKADDATRVEEIRSVARYLKERQRDAFAWSDSFLLLGDFNIFQTTDKTFQALTDAGFVIPKQVTKLPSAALSQHHFDQIAFIAPYLQKSERLKRCRAGVFQFYDYVYKDDQLAEYEPALAGWKSNLKTPLKRFQDWRTYHLSDHFPMWIEIDTDFSRGYLANRMRGKGRQKRPALDAPRGT